MQFGETINDLQQIISVIYEEGIKWIFGKKGKYYID